jgi:hypothetical protein
MVRCKLVIPKHLYPLFWDTDVESFQPAAHPRYTIERVLEHGEQADMAWLIRTFSVDQIRDVLRADRHLSARSATFWALVFDVPASEVAALQGHSASRP